MDNIIEIAISQLASELSKGEILIPKIDRWKEILYNSGQRIYYDLNEHRLRCREVPGTYGREYMYDDRIYSVLHEIFIKLYSDFDAFTKLFNCIAMKMNIYNLFNLDSVDLDDVDKAAKKRKLNFLLDKYPSKEFKRIRNSLNTLGLDFIFDDEYGDDLRVLSFEFTDKSKDKEVLIEWLYKNYPNILESYENAIKSYGNGDGVATLSHCRNIIEGIFTYEKGDKPKWLNGLKNACRRDKNIENIERPYDVIKLINNKGESINSKYNYPRFRIIYQAYTYLCDLGSHVNGAPIIDNKPDYEKTQMCDALMGLRITEDILIWYYQSESNKN